MIVAGWGGDVASNETGSNMPAGHVAALVASSRDRVVLEVDESWLDSVSRTTKPELIVLLNLSRDQLDRANEVRQIAERWRNLFAQLENVTVVANANDPLVVYAAEVANNVVWCDVPTPWTSDAVSCPRCTEPLLFQSSSWSSDCGFKKPAVYGASLRNEVSIGASNYRLDLSMPGAFNESNATMALCALAQLGVNIDEALSRMNALVSVAGRFSLRRWRGHRIQLLLAKNPAGFSAMLESLASGAGDVWIDINARIADGHDPSWLYDVPFELLRGRQIFCFGDRKLDLATRLDYAGVSFSVVGPDSALPTSAGPVPVLANYTAFQEWRKRSSPC
jgi:UDP-N-acetylmuramyl tripeptide synthase